MKPLRLVIPIVLAGAVLLFAVARMGGRGSVERYLLEREALRREMLERSAVARGLAGGPGLEEAREVVRWWTDAMAGLRKGHPRGAASPDRPAARDAGRDDAAEFERYAQDRAGVLRAGYAPALSAAEQGLRLDILALRPGDHPQTKARALRIDFALWGAPRRVERDSGAEGGARPQRRVVVPVTFRQLGFRFVDAAGNGYGEMSGTGEPYLVLRDPDRFDDALPPGIVLGTWWVDAFPREAARVEMTVSVQAQGTSPAALTPTFRFEVPVSDEWKLRPGETFRAETREVAPEPPATPSR
jgi:hypothetical protein